MSTTQLQVHRLAVTEGIEAIVQSLQEVLGQRLVAYAIGIKDPKAIGRYATGRQTPRAEVERRLRDLFQITRLLLKAESAETVRAWMIGANPQLADLAPIEQLHEGSVQPVIRAAGAFAEGE